MSPACTSNFPQSPNSKFIEFLNYQCYIHRPIDYSIDCWLSGKITLFPSASSDRYPNKLASSSTDSWGTLRPSSIMARSTLDESEGVSYLDTVGQSEMLGAYTFDFSACIPVGRVSVILGCVVG
jgi:hypothetical protein